MIWADLVHLSYNMWMDRETPEMYYPHHTALPYLRFDSGLWDDMLKAMAAGGLNMVVIDLGDAIKYESHPEIAVEGAWSVDKLKQELAKCRALGIEPIPKLNFSACHDAWMGQYSRMLSTPVYYDVCRNLISEVIDIFDRPRLFHLGMDEETASHQEHHAYVVIRQYDLWWHDLYFYIEQVEKANVRPWVWSDYIWNHPEAFYSKMPKTVLQSNWYYSEEFDLNDTYVKAYLDLEEHGYDQVPTGSNHSTPMNFEGTVKFSKEHIAPQRLLGFLQTQWRVNLEEMRQRHLDAIDQVAKAKVLFESMK